MLSSLWEEKAGAHQTGTLPLNLGPDSTNAPQGSQKRGKSGGSEAHQRTRKLPFRPAGQWHLGNSGYATSPGPPRLGSRRQALLEPGFPSSSGLGTEAQVGSKKQEINQLGWPCAKLHGVPETQARLHQLSGESQVCRGCREYPLVGLWVPSPHWQRLLHPHTRVQEGLMSCFSLRQLLETEVRRPLLPLPSTAL